ncbi:MAG: class I SAM-dependent methyltransferase [Candidatus Levybacteria bacterium]|nr:class I SAM-dependent methyltransferase [Candidatus Levybacteria bacterium]
MANNNFGYELEKIENDTLPDGVDLTYSLKASSLYDIVAKRVSNKIAMDHNSSYRDEIDQFIKLIPPQGLIADMGCGFGSEVAYFDSLGFKTLGVDISSESIELARKLYPNLKFIVGDFSNANTYEDFKVDGFHEHLSLMNLPKEEIKKVLTYFHDSLNNDGILQINFEEDDPGRSGWYAVPTSPEIEWEGKMVREVSFIYLSFFYLEELQKTIEQAGFKIISIKTHREQDHERNIITALCSK